MFSRGTSQQTIVFSCSRSQRLREQLHLIPITLNNYCSSRPLMIISHWKDFLFFRINRCLLLSHHFLCLVVPWRRQTNDRHWEPSTTWGEEYCTTKLMTTYEHPWQQMSTYEHLLALISSVRSSFSHPDLLLIHPPTFFQITPVLNTGLTFSDPLQLYKGYNAI